MSLIARLVAIMITNLKPGSAFLVSPVMKTLTGMEFVLPNAVMDNLLQESHAMPIPVTLDASSVRSLQAMYAQLLMSALLNAGMD